MAFQLRLWVVAMSLAFSADAMAAPEAALTDDQAVSYFGVTFPARLGDARRVSTADKAVSEAGRGFQAVYEHDRTETTIEVYPAVHGNVPDNDLRGPVITREFNGHKQNVLAVRSGGADLKVGREFTLTDSHKVPRMICAHYVIWPARIYDAKTQEPSDYFICMGAVNGQFMWTRTRFWHWPTAEATVRSFLGAWVDHLWR